MIELTNRILLNNGISIVPDDVALDMILSSGSLPEHIKVISSSDSRRYDIRNGTSITIDEIVEQELKPNISTDEFDYDQMLIDIISDDICSDPAYKSRVKIELDFFQRTDSMPFLYSLYKLMEQFRRDNVIWGVGRGSSCASLVLFILDIHMIDPVKYDIPFHEFSKEKNYE